MDELAIILQPRLRLFVAAVLPFDFQKAGDLAHVRPISAADGVLVRARCARFRSASALAIVGRHHLDEVRQRRVPIVQQHAGARRCRCAADGARPGCAGARRRSAADRPCRIDHADASAGAADRHASAGRRRLRPFSSLTMARLQSVSKAAVRVIDIGHAARHAGGEIAPRLAQHHHHAAGHIFAAMIAGAFHHGDGAGIAHRETLARHALEIGLAGDGAVQHGVADDDVLGRIAADACRLA